MKIVSIICPNCGGALELEDSREFGFCTFCGTKVWIQDEKKRMEFSGRVTFDESEKYTNYLNLASQAYDAMNMEEAYTYYTRALEIKQSDYLPVFRKALCAGYLSNGSTMRKEEVVSGISRAFDMVSDDSEKESMSEEIVFYAVNDKLQIDRNFNSSDDCDRYVMSIYNKISLLDGLYLFLDQNNTQSVMTFIDVEYGYGRLLGNNFLRYNAGTTIRKGKVRTMYHTYFVPNYIMRDIADINHRFTEEYKRLIGPNIEQLEMDIDETQAQINALPQEIQILHKICSNWGVTLGVSFGIILFSSSYRVVGVIIVIFIWIVHIICLIILTSMDKENIAANLYKLLKSQEKEWAKYKKRIRS